MLQLSDEDYPEQETEIIVQGTFETYKESNDETLYCRITDADMQKKNKKRKDGSLRNTGKRLADI